LSGATMACPHTLPAQMSDFAKLALTAIFSASGGLRRAGLSGRSDARSISPNVDLAVLPHTARKFRQG
jgi:hypothetical protein